MHIHKIMGYFLLLDILLVFEPYFMCGFQIMLESRVGYYQSFFTNKVGKY